MKLCKEQKEKQVSGLKKVYEFIKKNKMKIVVFSGVLIICAIFLVNTIIKPSQEEVLNDSVSIVQFHTDNSEAEKIKSYLAISEELNDFMENNKVMVTESEIIEKMKTSTLMSVENLEKEIKEIDKLISESKTQHVLISRIKNLIVQERLINKYLYNSYYEVNSILEEALKKYVGEKYGIIDIENIGFYTTIPERDGFVNFRIYYGKFENGIEFGIDSNLKDGMYALELLTTLNDPNPNDNDKYNKERNKILKEGLIQSGKLYDIVDKENLFSEKDAKKLKK